MANELLTRNTKMAVMLESVAGEYETPADSDFMPILDSSETVPGYDTIENKEMQQGLDRRPGRPTTQNGTCNVHVYLKGGENGAAPHYDPLLQSVLKAPTTRSNKTTVGLAALATVEASPSPTATQFDIAVASAFLAADDVILVDVSGDGSGDWEKATVLSATFDTDHETVVLTAALAGGAPTAANEIQLISRIDVDGSPGYEDMDCLLVDVSGDGSEYNEVIVLDVTGTTTQTVYVWPYLSAQPLDDADVLGGKTYKPQSSGHSTCTVTEFNDCDTQDGVRFDYAGVRFNMMIESAAVGTEAELHFNGESAKWKYDDTGTSLVTLGLTPDDGPDHYAPLCLGMTITSGDRRTGVDMHEFSLDMGLAIAKRPSMQQSSGFRSTFYSERMVGGSFLIDMLDASQFDAWIALEDTAITLRWADENQTIVLIIPYLQRETIEKGDTDGIRTQTVNWKADTINSIGPMVMAFFPAI